MDMKTKVSKIYNNPKLSQAKKVALLDEILIDCYNEMEAQDQNMHPEIQHNTEEGYRLAKNLIRQLHDAIDQEEASKRTYKR